MFYVICYDIPDNRRRLLFDIVRIQYIQHCVPSIKLDSHVAAIYLLFRCHQFPVQSVTVFFPQHSEY